MFNVALSQHPFPLAKMYGPYRAIETIFGAMLIGAMLPAKLKKKVPEVIRTPDFQIIVTIVLQSDVLPLNYRDRLAPGAKFQQYNHFLIVTIPLQFLKSIY